MERTPVQTLQGLFRSSQQHKQADFLARDFRQQKHKEAACKNAFVLLGQHRHELAAAFFILGEQMLTPWSMWQAQKQKQSGDCRASCREAVCSVAGVLAWRSTLMKGGQA